MFTLKKKSNRPLSLHIYKNRAFYHVVSHSWGHAIWVYTQKEGKRWGDLKRETDKRTAQQRAEDTRRRRHTGQTAFLLAPGLLGTGVPGSLPSANPGLDSSHHLPNSLAVSRASVAISSDDHQEWNIALMWRTESLRVVGQPWTGAPGYPVGPQE